MRAVFSAALTSSAMRFDASVFGRGEYLNENMLWYCADFGKRQRLLEIGRRFPGKADDHIGRQRHPGIDSRIRATSSRYSSRVWRRRIA